MPSVPSVPSVLEPARFLRFVLATVLGLAGCRRSPSWPDPPRPAGLQAFDVGAAERIRTALTAVESERSNAATWAELGMIYDSERLRTLALECFDVAARIDPGEPRWPYRTAVILAKLGRSDEAIAAIQHSISVQAEYAPSHYRLGLYRLEAGDFPGAEEAFRRATELDASYPGGWVGRARVHLQRDENEAAIEILERLAREQPGDGTVNVLLSNAYRQAGRVTEFEAGALLADEDVPVWNDPWELETRRYRRTPTMLQVGQALHSGRPEDALALLERARLEGSASEDSSLQAANALVALGRWDEARAEVELRLSREPNDTRALMLLVHLHRERGENEAALAVLKRITDLEPTHRGAWVARGGLELLLDHPDDAVASLRQAIELGLDDADIRDLLTSALVNAGRWEEAGPVLEASLRDRPDDGSSWALLALTRSRLGQLESAEEALRHARAGDPPAAPDLLRKATATIERKRRARDRRAGSEESDS